MKKITTDPAKLQLKKETIASLGSNHRSKLLADYSRSDRDGTWTIVTIIIPNFSDRTW